MNNNNLITILGPTACGKTSVATCLAERIGGEIISADSRQVYRRMDIGTGKDLKDYERPNGQLIPYHLIDIVEPGTKYNLFQYKKDFFSAYNDITGRGKKAILCGGTGLYIEAVLKGYELPDVPQNESLRSNLSDYSLEELKKMLESLKKDNGTNMHNKTDVDTKQRAIRAIEIEKYIKDNPLGLLLSSEKTNLSSSLIVGIEIDRNVRRKRITNRLKERLNNGMVEEVEQLLAEGVPAENLIYYGLEYKFVTQYIIGELSYDEMFTQLEIAIHQFAKRQMTWFRGMERRGLHIEWIKHREGQGGVNDMVNEIIKLEKR